MDETEIKKMYLFLIGDQREEKRQEAFEMLSGAGDPDARKLADTGRQIYESLSKADPEKLGRIIDELDALPDTDYWRSFVEVTGQVVIAKALAMEPSEARSKFLELGLEIIDRAFGSSFPLGDATLYLVDKAKKADPKLEEKANGIAMRNFNLTPERSYLRGPSGTEAAKPERKKQ